MSCTATRLTLLAIRLRAWFIVSVVIALPTMLYSCPAFGQDDAAMAALVRQDVRLARVADSLLVANAAMCRQTMPVTGAIIHSQDQYSGRKPVGFAAGPVAISAIVPGSAAASAGLAVGDTILAIGSRAIADIQAPAEGPLRDAVFAVMAEQPRGTLTIRGLHSGQAQPAATPFAITFDPPQGCRALVEVLAADNLLARSDGRVIQISLGMMEHLSDDDVVVIMAHELAHAVLEHRRRLSEAGVKKGFLGEFGSNRKRNRQVEVEADRLSVHLLANAGYDPGLAQHFWLSEEGRRVDKGLFRSLAYPSPTARAALIAREIEQFLAPGTRPSWPAHLLATRDQPF